jgi:hypothetical protein
MVSLIYLQHLRKRHFYQNIDYLIHKASYQNGPLAFQNDVIYSALLMIEHRII